MIKYFGVDDRQQPGYDVMRAGIEELQYLNMTSNEIIVELQNDQQNILNFDLEAQKPG